MTYQTIDWDAEAQNLKKAFGIAGQCFWREGHNIHHQYDGKFLSVKSVWYERLLCYGGYRVRIAINPRGLFFEMYRFGDEYCSASSAWGGAAPEIWVASGADFAPMKKALSRLAALSPEIGAMMNVSAHERMEAALEMEAENESKSR